MTVETQLTQFASAVDQFARCVDSLEEDHFLATTMGQWSVRDVVAHLIGWNRYIIEGSKQIKKGDLPFYDVDPGDNYSKVNAALVRKYSSTDRKELLHELRVSARELETFLKSLHPEDWAHDYGVRNQGSVITIENSVDELIGDYAHHQAQIEDWVKSRTGP